MISVSGSAMSSAVSRSAAMVVSISSCTATLPPSETSSASASGGLPR
ncbi:hypothetical protein ACIBCU_16800 [Streptomyces sp. NPDC051064]